MNDPADDAPVIFSLWPRLVPGKQRFNRRPLIAAQPKLSRHRPRLPPIQLDPQTTNKLNHMIEFEA
jgi:hypothetical protein